MNKLKIGQLSEDKDLLIKCNLESITDSLSHKIKRSLEDSFQELTEHIYAVVVEKDSDLYICFESFVEAPSELYKFTEIFEQEEDVSCLSERKLNALKIMPKLFREYADEIEKYLAGEIDQLYYSRK